jgi:hypothetical protein
VTRRSWPGFNLGVSPLRGGSFRRILRTQALRRGDCRARHPSDRPPTVPAVSRCRVRQHTTRAVNDAPDAPEAVNMSQLRDRCAAHCPDWPLQRQGRSLRSREFASLTLDSGASASPAGLAARARPEGQALNARGEPLKLDGSVVKPKVKMTAFPYPAENIGWFALFRLRASGIREACTRI